MKKVCVVGAGIAGLTAAYYLKVYGFDVTVLEASNRVGGRMTTDIVDGFIIDRGAQFLSESYKTLLSLIKEVGLGPEIIEAFPIGAVVREKRIRKVNPKNPLTVLTSGYLRPSEVWCLLSHGSAIQKKLLQLPLDDYSAWAALDDELLASYFARTYGTGILEYLIEPQLQGFFYQTPEESSKAMGLMLMGFLQRKGKVMVLSKGMGSLPEKLASNLDVKLNCKVSSISLNQDGRSVTVQTSSGSVSADKVVLATTATVARSIYRPIDEVEEKLLATSYSSTVNIGLAIGPNWAMPKHLRDVYGVLIPRRERDLVAAIGIENAKGPYRAPNGVLLDAMLDGKLAEDFMSRNDEEILAAASPELERYFPGAWDSLCFSHLVRWKEAEPRSPVGRSKKLQEYRQMMNAKKRVILAGDYMGFPFTDSAAHTGKWAATMIYTN